IDVQKIGPAKHIKCHGSRLSNFREIRCDPGVQLLQLALVKLVKLAFEKRGVRLPCRILREWCQWRILRQRHSSEKPCDIIRTSDGGRDGNCARRDLRDLLC